MTAGAASGGVSAMERVMFVHSLTRASGSSKLKASSRLLKARRAVSAVRMSGFCVGVNHWACQAGENKVADAAQQEVTLERSQQQGAGEAAH